jgi:hypothetical protein
MFAHHTRQPGAAGVGVHYTRGSALDGHREMSMDVAGSDSQQRCRRPRSGHTTILMHPHTHSYVGSDGWFQIQPRARSVVMQHTVQHTYALGGRGLAENTRSPVLGCGPALPTQHHGAWPCRLPRPRAPPVAGHAPKHSVKSVNFLHATPSRGSVAQEQAHLSCAWTDSVRGHVAVKFKLTLRVQHSARPSGQLVPPPPSLRHMQLVYEAYIHHWSALATAIRLACGSQR